MTDAELRQSCHTILPGHGQPSPAQTFAAMAAWCDANGIAHDVYGEGELIQSFEQKIADLLGFEAATFCITGTMTQVTALRLACMERGSRLVALHPTAHIFKHERGNHQLLDHFQAIQLGDPQRPFTLGELQAVPDRLAAVSLELPARELGGQSPRRDELEAIKLHCREQGIHLHMDGARLWKLPPAIALRRPKWRRASTVSTFRCTRASAAWVAPCCWAAAPSSPAPRNGSADRAAT